MIRILAVLLCALPAAASAQVAAPPPETAPAPEAPPPDAAATPAPAPVADEDEEEEKNEGGVALEVMFGPKRFSNDTLPNGSGNALLVGLRAFDHDGFIRSDFGLTFQRDSGSVEEGGATAEISSLGGGMELLIGFGIGPVEILGGGGLGVNWADGTLETPLGVTEYEINNLAFVGSYGGSISVLVGPLRPVFRIRRDVDFSTDSDIVDAGSITGTSFLFGVGLEFDEL